MTKEKRENTKAISLIVIFFLYLIIAGIITMKDARGEEKTKVSYNTPSIKNSIDVFLNKPEVIGDFPIGSILVSVEINDGYGDIENRQTYAEYAYSISKDEDFVKTMYAESKFRPQAVGVNRDTSFDYGIGQINSYWHNKIISNPEYIDPYFQIREAYKLYKTGTTFYGYYVRNNYKNNLIIK